MRVTVKLFARLRELAGGDTFDRDLPAPATVADAWDAIVADHPALAAHAATVSSAVNAEYARRTRPLADGDEVAFLPPVSGG